MPIATRSSAWSAPCATPICRKCHYHALRRSLCADCHSIRRSENAPLKRQTLLDQRRRRVSRIPHTLIILFAAALPGSGHLLRGAPRRASTLMLMALLVVHILAWWRY